MQRGQDAVVERLRDAADDEHTDAQEGDHGEQPEHDCAATDLLCRHLARDLRNTLFGGPRGGSGHVPHDLRRAWRRGHGMCV
jgi:hypothetical protein